ncbi:hypothetical protein KRM28CT15_42530 [Krasilnikovia sp. M28-CT-15]
MQIGELSRRTGASPRSLRYYESVGLLTSLRAGNGYREFAESALEQVIRIKLLLQVGLDIADIVAVLPCMDTPVTPRCAHARRRYDEQIERIEQQQELLAQAKALLTELRTNGAPTESHRAVGRIRAVSGNVTAGIR